MRGRPLLRTSYGEELRLLDTSAKRAWTGVFVATGTALPWLLPDDVLHLLALGCVAAIGAIGLNLVTGYAGQVSLGHAFFLAIGAYTAAALSGEPDGRTFGLGVTNLLVWLPAAGLAAMLAGVAVAPLATRLGGLYLATVTLGLVVVGTYVFSEWAALTGGAGVGRPAAVPALFGYRLDVTDAVGTRDQKLYLLMFALLLLFAVAAANLARSKVGRAFTAIRDREIAASVIGVDPARYKTIAFAVSSCYAGCAGALLYTVSGFVEPGSFDLLLSVQYLAMVLIGGAGTISGSIMGAFFVTALPRLTREVPAFVLVISPSPEQTPNTYQLATLLYGVLIVVFLIAEPRGLFGIWTRLRDYWKSWPFSY